MGAKERLQKELDLLLEKMKFWRYVIFGIVSGTVGMIFGASQNKLQLNLVAMVFLIFGLISIVISIKRLDTLTKKYEQLLNQLERTK